jgi:hypothetical protein
MLGTLKRKRLRYFTFPKVIQWNWPSPLNDAIADTTHNYNFVGVEKEVAFPIFLDDIFWP